MSIKNCSIQSHVSQLSHRIDGLEDILSFFSDISKDIEALLHQNTFRRFSHDDQVSNSSGDDVQPLDILANNIFKEKCETSDLFACFASEEEDTIFLPYKKEQSPYILAVDPLDGSSNIDVNVPVGTLFSVFKRNEDCPLNETQFFRLGREQILSGYILYGTTVELVYTIGDGVHRFVLDHLSGLFYEVSLNMTYPDTLYCYSMNESLLHKCDMDLQNYIQDLKERKVTSRYVGSLVSDFHRNLLKGGIYIYPKYQGKPSGKLRLLYEAFPLAFVSEQAGGGSSNGISSILDVTCDALHQRSPLYLGTLSSVREFVKHLVSS